MCYLCKIKIKKLPKQSEEQHYKAVDTSIRSGEFRSRTHCGEVHLGVGVQGGRMVGVWRVLRESIKMIIIINRGG